MLQRLLTAPYSTGSLIGANTFFTTMLATAGVGAVAAAATVASAAKQVRKGAAGFTSAFVSCCLAATELEKLPAPAVAADKANGQQLEKEKGKVAGRTVPGLFAFVMFSCSRCLRFSQWARCLAAS